MNLDEIYVTKRCVCSELVPKNDTKLLKNSYNNALDVFSIWKGSRWSI